MLGCVCVWICVVMWGSVWADITMLCLPSSPTLRGHMVTYFEARRIVLKMLAVSSSHSKMQNELSNCHAVALLSDCLSDSPQENVTNAAIALANIAQNMTSHNVVGS